MQRGPPRDVRCVRRVEARGRVELVVDTRSGRIWVPEAEGAELARALLEVLAGKAHRACSELPCMCSPEVLAELAGRDVVRVVEAPAVVTLAAAAKSARPRRGRTPR